MRGAGNKYFNLPFFKMEKKNVMYNFSQDYSWHTVLQSGKQTVGLTLSKWWTTLGYFKGNASHWDETDFSGNCTLLTLNIKVPVILPAKMVYYFFAEKCNSGYTNYQAIAKPKLSLGNRGEERSFIEKRRELQGAVKNKKSTFFTPCKLGVPSVGTFRWLGYYRTRRNPSLSCWDSKVEGTCKVPLSLSVLQLTSEGSPFWPLNSIFVRFPFIVFTLYTLQKRLPFHFSLSFTIYTTSQTKKFLKMHTSPNLLASNIPYNHASQTWVSSNHQRYSAVCQGVHKVSGPMGTFYWSSVWIDSHLKPDFYIKINIFLTCNAKMVIKFLFTHQGLCPLKQSWERNRRNVICILGAIQGKCFRSSDKQN